ncbi:hypothetical protein [Paracraurococcus lichenis]|uniref:Uncharacterized protein n=1 Tax=Paracraurococcus lichenis TaxID=3064888 RepID=A0ABT9EAF4_9PROT|nr:hypothetical protein [Paracraurococcus sp. LOR1-02]MDO9713182.1 hypothetical protein [Paracraurococcus sp. LOR1-02]
MRKRPGTARGVVFVTAEDEHGVADILVSVQVGERNRTALVGARLLMVEGRLERQAQHVAVPIAHVIARRLLDRTDPLRRLKGPPRSGLPELGRSHDFHWWRVPSR